MSDLLMISDMLISDYSSCGADFANGSIILINTPLREELSIFCEESPYFTVSDMDEVLQIINDVIGENIRKNSKWILDFYSSFETGHAFETVSNVILKL